MSSRYPDTDDLEEDKENLSRGLQDKTSPQGAYAFANLGNRDTDPQCSFQIFEDPVPESVSFQIYEDPSPHPSSPMERTSLAPRSMGIASHETSTFGQENTGLSLRRSSSAPNLAEREGGGFGYQRENIERHPLRRTRSQENVRVHWRARNFGYKLYKFITKIGPFFYSKLLYKQFQLHDYQVDVRPMEVYIYRTIVLQLSMTSMQVIRDFLLLDNFLNDLENLKKYQHLYDPIMKAFYKTETLYATAPSNSIYEGRFEQFEISIFVNAMVKILHYLKPIFFDVMPTSKQADIIKMTLQYINLVYSQLHMRLVLQSRDIEPQQKVPSVVYEDPPQPKPKSALKRPGDVWSPRRRQRRIQFTGDVNRRLFWLNDKFRDLEKRTIYNFPESAYDSTQDERFSGLADYESTRRRELSDAYELMDDYAERVRIREHENAMKELDEEERRRTGRKKFQYFMRMYQPPVNSEEQLNQAWEDAYEKYYSCVGIMDCDTSKTAMERQDYVETVAGDYEDPRLVLQPSPPPSPPPRENMSPPARSFVDRMSDRFQRLRRSWFRGNDDSQSNSSGLNRQEYYFRALTPKRVDASFSARKRRYPMNNPKRKMVKQRRYSY